MRLNRDIADSFQVISLLLVFVLAYFSAIYGQIQRAVRAPAGPAQTIGQLTELRGEHRTYRRLLVFFAVVVTVIFALVAPLAVRIIAALARQFSYSTLRAGLLLVEVFLICALAAAGWLIRQLNARIRDIGAAIEFQRHPPPE